MIVNVNTLPVRGISLSLRFKSCGLLAAVAMLCGCGGQQASGAVSVPITYARVPLSHSGGTRSSKTRSLLYVSESTSSGGTQLQVYDPTGNPFKLLGTITKTLVQPLDLAVDSTGTLYVADSLGHAVYAYTDWRKAPSRTYRQGHNTRPTSVAIDSHGTLYVVDEPAQVGSNYCDYRFKVRVYPSGSMKPTRTLIITNTADCSDASAAVDDSDNFYVEYNVIDTNVGGHPVTDAVTEFAPNSKKGTTIWLDPILIYNSPHTLSVDSTGDLLVPGISSTTSGSGPCGVGIFPPGKTSPSQVLVVAQGCDSAALLSPDQSKVYTSSTGTAIFQYPSGKLLKTVSEPAFWYGAAENL